MSTPKKRILHVLGALSGGGIQNFVLTLLRHRDQDRFEMDVCTMARESGPLAPQAESLGGRVYACSLSASPATFLRRFEAIVRAGRYDVVHVNRSSSVCAFPLMAARRAGVPVRIAQYQNILDRRSTWSPRLLAAPLMRRLALAEATRFIGVSEWVLDTHFGHRWRNDPRFLVIPNPVDVACYADPSRRAAIRAEFGIRTDDLVIGHSARFSEAKNHNAIVSVALPLCRDFPNLKFLLVGDGHLRPGVEARVRALGLQDRVLFAGWREDIPDLLSAMDVYFFPSAWEGFGIALLEAQAAALPCIASDLPCFREVLHPDLWERRFPLRDLSVAENQLRRLLLDGALRRRLGTTGQAYSARYDVRLVARRIEALYTGTTDHQ